MKPKVSVLVLTYNQENTVKRTLDSIINQVTEFEYEIIIGDDDSTDQTRIICEEYCNKYDNIIILNRAPNKGVVVNYRDCYAKARGKYIMGCAGDDWWHNENKIQIQVEYMENNPNCSLSFTGYTNCNVESSQLSISQPKQGNYTIESLLLDSPIAALTICYRNNPGILGVLNHVIENKWSMEDLPLVLYMASRGVVSCIEGNFATYSIVNGSISNASTLERKEQFEKQVLEIRQYYKKLFNVHKVSDTALLDKYYISLSTNGIRYNNRFYCIRALRNITNKRTSDYLKLLLCFLPFGFKLLRNYMKALIVS